MSYELVELGKVCKFVRGPFGGSLKKNIFVKDGYAVYEQQHAIYNQFNEVRYFIDENKFKEMIRFELLPNDLIMSCSGTMGKVAIVPSKIKQGVINQALLKLTPNPDINRVYLKWLMTSSYFQDKLNELSGGAAIQNVASVSLLKQIKIPLPPLLIQQKIVEGLDAIFAEIELAIQATEANAKHAEALFLSYLAEIFEHGGDGWDTQNIGKLCDELFAGGDVPKDRMSKIPNRQFNIPIFTNGEKNKGLYGFTDKARVTKPSITISARGTIGYSQLRSESFYPAIRLIVATPNLNTIDLNFLKYAIKSLRFIHSGASIPQLTVPMIKDYQIKLPNSIQIQRTIVSKLDSLSSDIEILMNIFTKKLESLNLLKQAILQQAFNGELVKE